MTEQYFSQMPPEDLVRIDEKYITAAVSTKKLSERHVTCIRSPMGSGKNELLDRFMTLHPPKSCLWLSSRKTYSYSMQKRLEKHRFNLADDQEHVGRALKAYKEYIIC
jgi:hypothetical protein